MPRLLVTLDEATFRALHQVSPAGRRGRAEFIRQAIEEAILKQEYARMREAYLKHPDCGSEADDWSNCEQIETD